MHVEINGITWHVHVAGEGPPLLLLHGFTEGIAAWADLLPELSRQHQVMAVDLIGHGQSAVPLDPNRYRIEQVIADLGALIDRFGWRRFSLLGYSLGGRVAMHLALAMPERIEALVLESASPGIADPELRKARRQSDEALAQKIEHGGVDAFITAWERLPMFAREAELHPEERKKFQLARRQHSALGLANVLRGLGQGRVPCVSDRLGELTAPALLLVGEHDTHYVDLASQMKAQLTHAQVVEISGAGHAVHREQPQVFMDRVGRFLQEHTSRPTESRDGS